MKICAICKIVMAMALTFASGRCMATESDAELRLYVDSIRNHNMVYTETEAKSVLSLFNHLQGNVPQDSLRLYVTEGLLSYSWFLVNQNEWFICRHLLDTADRLCPENNEHFKQKIAVAKAGLDLFDSQYAKAGPVLLRASEYFRKNGDTVEWLTQCVNLGLFYNRTHNKAKALECYSTVLQVADNKKYENYYSIVTGYAEKIEEDSIIGLSTFKKALDISLANGYTFLLADNYNNLAKYHYRFENYREALLNARKALRYSEQFDDNKSRLTALGIMADIYYIKKDYVAAYAMEEQINKLSASISKDQAFKIYEHLAYTDSLINWAERNFPDISHNVATTEQPDNSKWVTIAILLVAFAIGLTVAALTVSRHRRLSHRKEEESVELHLDNSPPATEDVPTGSREPSIASDALGLKLIATGYNSMLDRVRSAIKDIPKTGNADADAKVRAIYVDLLQSRLPEFSGKFVDEVSAEEDKFIKRLREEYPVLTRNDLRMALYIRGGLSLHEICSISGLQTKSANQARYRLRKSLGLLPNESLEAFIMAF